MTTKPRTPRVIAPPVAPPPPAIHITAPRPAQDPNVVLVANRKKRLRELIAKEGAGGAASLARKAGRAQSGINHMASHKYHFGERAARELEAQLDLPHLYFDQHESAGAGSMAVHLVPVMEWHRVGRHPADPDMPTIPTAWSVGPRAVSVIARAMMWGGDGLPGVPVGWHAIIDPDAPIHEGDLVCCWLPGATEATLRQYLMDGGVPYLYPVDRRQASGVEWTKDTRIVGPLIGAAKSFRS